MIKNNLIKSISISVVLTSILVLSGCGNSKSTFKKSPEAEVASCNISGFVTNLGTVKGARVAIYDNNNLIGYVTTDQNGKYTFKSLQSSCDSGIVSGGIDLGLEPGEQDDRTMDYATSFLIPATQGQVNVNIIGNDLRSVSSCDVSNLSINDKLYYVFAKEIMQNIGFDDPIAKEIAAKGLPCANSSTPPGTRYNKQAIIDAAMAQMDSEGISATQKAVNVDVLNMVLDFYESELAKNTDIARATVHTVADAVDYFAEHSVNGATNSNDPQPAIFTAEDVYLIGKLLTPGHINDIENAIAAKADASRTRFGHIIAAWFIDTRSLEKSGVNPGIAYTIPVAPDPSPKIDQDCMASAAPGVCRAPTDDKFLVAIDYDDVDYINGAGVQQRGGALVYQATAENGLSIVRHVNTNDDAKYDIERIDIYRKFIVLNDAAKALDPLAQYDLIKDKIQDIFTLDAATFKLDADSFTSPKTLLFTFVADFNDFKGQSVNEYHEYATVSFPVVVERNDATKTLKFTIPANAKAVFTAKANGQTPIVLQGNNETVNVFSKKDGVVSYNIGEYYRRMIAKVEAKLTSATEQRILNKIKRMLVSHVTNYTNVKIYVTMNELEAGTLAPKNNFVRNPGTFNPADFALTSPAAANIYRNVFTSSKTTKDGLMKSLNFRVILENPVEN
jgi:hypothetical protein